MLKLTPVNYQFSVEYEPYLPTAFNESLSLLQKVNKVIHEMNKIGQVTNGFVEMWNKLIEWITNEGLEDTVEKKLDEWLADGTLDKIINQKLFGELYETIEGIKTEMVSIKATLKKKLEKEDLYYVLVDDFGADPTGKTNSSAGIQAAINAGKHIRFSEGATYLIGSPIRIPSNRVLEMGRSTTLRRNADINSMFLNDSDGRVGGYSANTNIHIKGGNVDLNGDNFATKCTSFGFGHCNNITIEDVRFRNIYAWHYVELNACLDSRVSNCIFDGYLDPEGTEMLQLDLARDTGVFPWFGPYDDTPCRNILIDGCTFKNGKKGIGSHSMVADVTHDFIKIVNNHFDNLSKDGIECQNYARFIVKGNTFYNCDTGVAIRSFGKDNPVYGVTIEGNTFNDIDRTENSRGIHVWSSVNRGSIVNNVMNKVGRHGIGIDYGNWWNIANNVVTNCQQAGIYIYGTSHVTVTGNNLSNNNLSNTADRYGVTIGFNSADIVANIMVMGNYIDSIGAKHSDKTFVTNNTINSAANTSLVESNGNARLIVKDNFIGASYQV